MVRLTRAYETGDVDGLVALLTEDVWVAMPPVPLEYQGRELAARFHAAVTFRQGRTYQLVPTRANGQVAFAAYLRDPDGRRCALAPDATVVAAASERSLGIGGHGPLCGCGRI